MDSILKNEAIALSIESELNRVEKISEIDKERNYNDYLLIIFFINDPEEHPRVFLDKLIAEGRPIQNYNVKNRLNRQRLHSVSTRKRWIRNIQKHAIVFSNLIENKNNQGRKHYNQLKKYIFGWKKDYHILDEKAIIIEFLLMNIKWRDENFYKLMEKFVQLGSASHCKSYLRKLIRIIGLLHGYDTEKTKSNQLNETSEEIKRILESERSIEEDVESVLQENELLRNALEIVQIELENLRKETEEEQMNIKNEVILGFLRDLNSQKYGAILNSISMSERIIIDLWKQGWKPDPPEIEGIYVTLNMLVNFLERYGLTRIDHVGVIKTITTEELIEYDYVGSEFKTKNENKKVKIIRNGWKYKNIVISRPEAREIEI